MAERSRFASGQHPQPYFEFHEASVGELQLASLTAADYQFSGGSHVIYDSFAVATGKRE